VRFWKKAVKDRDRALYLSDVRQYRTSLAINSYLEEVFKVSSRHSFHLGRVRGELSDGSQAKRWNLPISGGAGQREVSNAG
jgi:hypothetical protein